MVSSQTTIHIPKDADIARVVEIITNASAKRIFLVLPENSHLAERVLNFQILKRESESMQKELIIVSGDPRLQGLANKAGLQAHQMMEEFASGEGGILSPAPELSQEEPPAEEDGSGGAGVVEEDISALQEEKESEPVHLAPKKVSDIIPRLSHTHRTRPPSGQDIGAQKDGGLLIPIHIIKRKSPRVREEKQYAPVPDAHPHTLAPGPAVDDFDTTAKRYLKKFTPSFSDPEKKKRAVFEVKEFPPDQTGIHVPPALPPGGFGTRIMGLLRFPGRLFVLILMSPLLLARGMGRAARRFMGGGALIIFLLVVLAAAGVVAYQALPKVEIDLYPHVENVAVHITLQAETTRVQVDDKKYLIGGQVLEEQFAYEQEFSTTGQEQIEEYATGTIRVFNEYSSAPQTLVENTRFVSNDGLIFRTSQTLVIPGAQIQEGRIIASSTAVSVRAAEPGEKYNIGSSTFSIPGFAGTPKFTGFYGKSDQPMEGGYKGTAQIATKQDLEKAQEALKAAVSGRAADALRAKIPSGYILAPDGLVEEIPNLTLSVEEGDRAEKFQGSILTIARALVMRQADLDAVIDGYFTYEYAAIQGVQLLPSREITYLFSNRNFGDGKFTIELVVKQALGGRIDIDSIRSAIQGNTEEQLRAYFAAYPGLDRAEIRFWPFWVHEVPSNEERVFVEVKYESSGE